MSGFVALAAIVVLLALVVGLVLLVVLATRRGHTPNAQTPPPPGEPGPPK